MCSCAGWQTFSSHFTGIPGVQRQIVHCVERTNWMVEEHFCDPLTRPDNNQTSCNKELCPAMWVCPLDITPDKHAQEVRDTRIAAVTCVTSHNQIYTRNTIETIQTELSYWVSVILLIVPFSFLWQKQHGPLDSISSKKKASLQMIFRLNVHVSRMTWYYKELE